MISVSKIHVTEAVTRRRSIKKGVLRNFAKSTENSFFYRTPPVAAFDVMRVTFCYCENST